jgi:hypothetical protein
LVSADKSIFFLEVFEWQNNVCLLLNIICYKL